MNAQTLKSKAEQKGYKMIFLKSNQDFKTWLRTDKTTSSNDWILAKDGQVFAVGLENIEKHLS